MNRDWHRYNLKRRVASLPPLASEIFAEKVLANKASAAATAARASFEKRCEACEKTYFSQNAYVNHLGSQKHRLLTARLDAKAGNETESLVDSTFSLGDPMENASTTTESTMQGDSVDPTAEAEFEDVVDGIKDVGLDDAQGPLSARPGRPAPSAAVHQKDHPLVAAADSNDDEEEHHANVDQCLFCNYVSPTIDLNLLHMSRQHGLFIPEREFLVDLPGLINYLSETVLVLHECLYCHKLFHTGSGVQTHMRDRGHCMIAYSTEDEQMEIGDFYDFRSTYSDDEEEEDTDEETSGGVSLGVKRDVKTTMTNEQGEDVDMPDEDDEGWESDSTVSSVPTDEITSVPSIPERRPKPKTHKSGSLQSPSTPLAVYHDEYELHLPSGRTAGHRSLRPYFRQNLRNYPTPEERAERQRTIEDARHDSDADDEEDDQQTEGSGRGRQIVSRANGGLGMVGVSDAKKKEVRTAEKRALKRAERADNRRRAGNEKRANFQKHFRDEMLQ